MAFRVKKNELKERGQSLVLILLILVIGAVVAFAIAARTIQDIRRTGQERLSDRAGSMVETILDVMTSPSQLDLLIKVNPLAFVGLCDENSGNIRLNAKLNEICQLDEEDLKLILDEFICDDGDVQIRFEGDEMEKTLKQDEVLEVYLTGTSGGTMTLFSTGAKNVIVKVYGVDELGSVVLQEPARAFSDDATSGWGLECLESETGCAIPYDSESLFARIRVISVPDNAEIRLLGAPPQDISMRATCYLSGVYREFVRQVPLYDSVPECFDYVLFDGDTEIDEFGSSGGSGSSGGVCVPACSENEICTSEGICVAIL